MRYASICSGIEAATVAWHSLAWTPALFAEIDKFPSRVLAHHYPEVPNVGDFTKIQKDEHGPIDILVGGTPCQDFSVAGPRAGMDGGRGQLTVEFAHLAGRLRPRWLVWENVPGVLSIDGGWAFGTFLGMLGQLGYGVAYRILDAQYLGVPQRRRRVFVVGHLGDWRRAAAVLFERHSLQGDTPPRRQAGQRVADSLTVGANQCGGFPGDFTEHTAPTLPARKKRGGGLGTDFDCDGGLISAAVTSKWAKGSGGPSGDECQNLATVGPLSASMGSGLDGQDVDRIVVGAVAFAIQERACAENPDAGPDGAGFRDDDTAYTLEARPTPQSVATFPQRHKQGQPGSRRIWRAQ
jgi:DNA (cytosine-5)-methyltransferase 1